MKPRKIAITIWGEIKGDIKEYYFEMKAMMSGLGYEITHLGSVDVEELIISIISKYIDADNGEVYACSKEEAIVAYAHFKDAKKCSLETFEFIKNIS